MAKRQKAEPTPDQPPFTIEIEGETITLTPELPALMGIEAATGKTLYQLLVASRSIPIRDMAMILRFLAGPACPIGALTPPPELMGRVMAPFDTAAEALIVRAGMMFVLAAILLPISAAVRGAVDEHGQFLPGWNVARVLKVEQGEASDAG